jgi:hypothetical protein
MVAGPPVAEARLGYWAGVLYLALFGSVLCFALYFPVVRKIGPGKAAYSSVLVPIIAMSLSTAFEAYRWSRPCGRRSGACSRRDAARSRGAQAAAAATAPDAG